MMTMHVHRYMYTNPTGHGAKHKICSCDDPNNGMQLPRHLDADVEKSDIESSIDSQVATNSIQRFNMKQIFVHVGCFF